MTLTGDIVGRTLIDTQRIQVQEETWDYVTRADVSGRRLHHGRDSSRASRGLTPVDANLNILMGAVGLKLNPFGSLLISGNVLLSQGKRGLQDYVTQVVSVDYSF